MAMPKIKLTIGETGMVTYSDSAGHKYKGPLKDAPSYVEEAAKKMDEMLQSIDSNFVSLLHRERSDLNLRRAYRMTIGSFDWFPIASVALVILAAIGWIAFKILMGT